MPPAIFACPVRALPAHLLCRQAARAFGVSIGALRQLFVDLRKRMEALSDSSLAAECTRWCTARLASEAKAMGDISSNGYSLRQATPAVVVGPSAIPGAGLGVHVHCEDVPLGAVVAVYAGVYIPTVPLPVWAATRGEATIVDVLQLAKLYGGGALDNCLADASFDEVSSYWLVLEAYAGVMCGLKAAWRVGGDGAAAPHAVGQFINHPPRGVAANVGWQEFLWGSESEGIAANRLHRGLWYIDPATSEKVILHNEGVEGSEALRPPGPGVAIVALRNLRAGEELYMDYKLSRPYPSWYTPVDQSLSAPLRKSDYY